MKAFFKAIRNGDFEKVKEYLQKKPELVNTTAKLPPKKDDGQSPLQIAYKTGNFEIANYLIESGADVNFMEKESVNDWKIPVIHDAVRACVFNSRYSVLLDVKVTEDGFKDIMGAETTKEEFTEALNSLKKLIEYGAKLDSLDSYENSLLDRLMLDISQVTDEKRHSPEVHEDLNELISLLISSGLEIKENQKEEYKDIISLLDLSL